jgi:hypothetical protein
MPLRLVGSSKFGSITTGKGSSSSSKWRHIEEEKEVYIKVNC